MSILTKRAACLLITWALTAPAIPQVHDDDGDDGPGKPTSEITITARRLDAARANIEPSLGAATYALTNDAVEARPSGETTTIAQILLQAPGAAQDGSGKLRVRQSQGALQYRINNVILPDGLTDLGESLSPRIAAKVELMTGALPAQYGLNTGGVVNVTTKDGVYLDGGQAELYGGSHGEIEPAIEYGGSIGKANFFVTGSYLRNRVGLPSLDGSANPPHDRTRQYEGLTYFDYVIDPKTRVALILGASDERFQLPNRTGLDAATANIGSVPFQSPLVFNGLSSIPSVQRDDSQGGINRYAVLSLLHTTDQLTFQIAGFARYSRATLSAKGVADILFTGIGRMTRDTVSSMGLQAENVYELSAAHTLRAGMTTVSDIHRGEAQTLVLPIDASGMQTAGALKQQNEASRLATRQDSLFVQDEWRPVFGVTVNIGGRVDHVKALTDRTRFSPRASLVWQPQPEATFHIGYARYFVPAPVDGVTEKPGDLALTSASLPTAAGNAVRPETDDYYDAGFQYAAGPLTAGIDAYWRRADNLIDEGIFGAAAQTASFNYAEGRVRGVELSLTYNAGRLSAWANIAVAEAQGRGIASNQYYFTLGQLSYAANHWIRAANSQTVTLSGGISYRLGVVRLSGDMLYGSGLRRTLVGGTPNGAHMPGYVQADFSAVWQVATFGKLPLDLRADIVNAFDRRYALGDGSALGASLPQWGTRRGAFLGVEQSF
jgi:outer membrane cobalamin receptor